MAKVTLRPEFEGISGKVGNMLFRTYKNGEVRMYKAPEYKRSTPVSNKEHKIRELFYRRCKRVSELLKSGISKQEAWAIAKKEIN